MRRTASIVKPAISRTRIRTSPGFRPRAAAGRTTRICEWILGHNLAPVPGDPADVAGRHDAALIGAFKGGGHARSGQLLRAGSKQSILLNAAAPSALVRQMESTSRDLFAPLAACGGGRTGCTRHQLAGNAFRSRAVAAARCLFPDLAFEQLSRRPARRWSARRRGGGLVLPRRAAR